MHISGRKIPERRNIWGRGPESVMSGSENRSIAGIKWEHGRVKVKVAQSFRPSGLYSPWNSPGQNTGVGSLSLLQRIFPTQGLNPCLLHCRWILHKLSFKGSPHWREKRCNQRRDKELLPGPHGSGGLNYGNSEGSERWSNWGHILKEE